MVPIFRQDTTCPGPTLLEFTACAFSCTGLSPCTCDFQTLPLTTPSDFAIFCSPRRYWGILVDFFSSGYLDVSSSPVRLVNLCIQLTIVTDCTGLYLIHRRAKGSDTLPALFAD